MQSQAETWLLISHTLRREGELVLAKQAITGSVENYRELEDDIGLASSLYELGAIEMYAGRTAEAFASFDEGLVVARRSGARLLEGSLTYARGGILQSEGKLAAALEHHEEAARIFGDLGSRYRAASALFYLATAYLERSEAKEAWVGLKQARNRIRGVGAPRYEALIAACSATALAMLQRTDEAKSELDLAEISANEVFNEPSLNVAISIHRKFLDVQLGLLDGDKAVLESEALVVTEPNDDTRIALRVLRTFVNGETGIQRLDTLTVWPDGRAFLAPNAKERTKLPDQSPLQRILAHLAIRRTERPGEVTPIEEIIRVGWEGEKISAEAALNRAYVAIATLRKKGLRDILINAGGGYSLSRSIIVRRHTDHEIKAD